MAEKPIIFNTEMVQAILDGRKTQTRRVIKPQPADHHWEMFNGAEYPDGRKYTHHLNLIECERGQFLHSWHSLGDHIDSSEECNQRILCPYGKPGDLLYVRETWLQVIGGYIFKSSVEVPGKFQWKPSIHMPKKASRIWLKVKDVRVERVQDITWYDIEQEGVDVVQGWDTPDVVFAKWIELWDSINAKRGFGWDENPWVWVVEFDVVSTKGKPLEEHAENEG